MEYYTLSNGLQLPRVGYGTYKTEGETGVRVVTQALEAGYRLLDTASFYGNEEAVREGIRRSGIAREELLLTSKAWRNEMGYENVLAAFDRSCRRLGVDYLDLYLLHWPRVPYSDPDWKQHNAGSWRALEELYRAGRVRAIGVSNFLPEHLDALLETAELCPMVDQIEYHPGWNQPQVLDWCRAHGTLVEAWSPMGRRRVLEHPLVTRLAAKYGVSPAQLCIRFALENGVQPLPKSSSPERMAENRDVFDFALSPEDLRQLNAMEPAGWSGLDPRMTETE
ncbi:MAG: aldo/keto reductase [Candidatus Onthomonas sp.]